MRARSVLTTVVLSASLPACVQRPPEPPETRVDSVVDTLHGVAVPDPYRWLEDQESEETRAWIDAQNAYAERVLGALPGREDIARRAAELLRVESITMPIARGSHDFFMKRAPDQQLFVIYMRDEAGVDHKLIDPHGMSEDQRTTVELMDVTDDGRTVVYAVRNGGEDEVEIRFFDVESRTDLPDRLPRARYMGANLLSDRSGLYYTRMDSVGPRVYYHALGSPPESDRMLFGEGYGPEKIITSGVTEDGRWLGIVVLHGAAADRTEVYYKDLRSDGPIRALVNDIPARFFPSFAGDHVLLQTNWEAPNGRLLRVPLANPARSQWKEIIPESDSAVLEGVAAVGGRIFITTLEAVKSRLTVHDLDGNRLSEIELPAVGTIAGVSGRWSSPQVYYSFLSFHIPLSIYRYNAETGESALWFQPRVPFDPERFTVEQVFYTSKDGTRVPMFLVHRRDLQRNGENPTMLTGYGGFTVSLTPFFASEAVIIAEHGGVFAVANLRGGGEFGEEWHRAGMLDRKQNVFDDFVAAAEWLIANNYTTPERLGISGGSNGGLLVGAAMTQRPDLFAAVICEYPLLDMVRYHKFLVAQFWVPEYGSADDSAQFAYLYRYSPYHNVRDGTPYPAVLFITGDADTRVAPLHARKMTARVQAATSSDKPVLLLYDTRSGHAGGVPVSKQIEDQTNALHFFFSQTASR